MFKIYIFPTYILIISYYLPASQNPISSFGRESYNVAIKNGVAIWLIANLEYSSVKVVSIMQHHSIQKDNQLNEKFERVNPIKYFSCILQSDNHITLCSHLTGYYR